MVTACHSMLTQTASQLSVWLIENQTNYHWHSYQGIFPILVGQIYRNDWQCDKLEQSQH